MNGAWNHQLHGQMLMRQRLRPHARQTNAVFMPGGVCHEVSIVHCGRADQTGTCGVNSRRGGLRHASGRLQQTGMAKRQGERKNSKGTKHHANGHAPPGQMQKLQSPLHQMFLRVARFYQKGFQESILCRTSSGMDSKTCSDVALAARRDAICYNAVESYAVWGRHSCLPFIHSEG